MGLAGGHWGGFAACLARAVVHSWCCLLFSVSNSVFSLLPCPTTEFYLVNTVICIYCK